MGIKMSEYNNLNKGVTMAEVKRILGHASKTVIDNIPQEEINRAQNPQKVVDNIPADELKGVKNNG